jgi:CubicO group peptidase (beta-lactamase class C family)
MSASKLERINRHFQKYIEEEKLAGIVTLVARKGRIVHFREYGWSDVESKIPIQKNSLFRIYSMTKPITSVAVMMLVEEGKIRLFDKVSQYIPEISNMEVFVDSTVEGIKTEKPNREMTIHDLLTHTAGLPHNPPYRNPDYEGKDKRPLLNMYAKAKLRDADQTLEETMTKLAKLPLLYHPGETRRYGMATDILARIIEIVSGKDFDQFLRENIFEPLKMENTEFHITQNEYDNMPKIYMPSSDGKIEKYDGGSKFDYVQGKYLSGSGGLISTAYDYYKFCQMFLNKGELDGIRVLGRKTVEYMTINHLPKHIYDIYVRGRGEGFGLGFFVVTDPAESQVVRSIGSHGWGGGANTFFWIDPKEELVAIILTQFRPFMYYPIRDEFKFLVYQAIVD